MQLKTVTAPDLPAALRKVKEELGPDAVIVATRRVKDRRGGLGIFAREMVEITAAHDPEAGRPARRAARTYAIVGGDEDSAGPLAGDDAAGRTGPAGQAGRDGGRTSGGLSRESVLFYVRPLREELRVLTASVASLQQAVSRRLEAPPVGGMAQVRGEIAELRQMVARMGAAAEEPATAALPEALRAWAMRLADAGVDLALIRPALERLAADLSPLELARPESVRDGVLDALRRQVAVAEALEGCGDRARVLAFVGPTGVGKTTTIAKLAGQRLATRSGARVALLTLDTFRVGAVAHLRAFAEILGLPVHVATDAAELDALVRRHLDHDLVLIDTAGGNPRDERLLGELRALLGQNPYVETHLCVSATTKPRDLADIGARFAPLAIEKLVFTKIDETNSGGSLFNFLAQSGKPLALLTNGQRVPEDLAVASKDAFCRWVMGE